jgi:hypothetical protein
MKRALVMAAVSLFCVNCAAMNAARSGNLAGAAEAAAREAKEAAEKLKAAKDKAEAECKPLNERVGNIDGDDAAKAKAVADARAKGYGVNWNEERAIGGAIAIGFAGGGNGIFCDITDKDPKALKEKADKGGRASVKLAPGAKNDLDAYVALVGDYVAQGSTRPGIAWTFGVIDDDSVNAVSTPGGYVLVTTGLLKLIENEAQLAGVLGHEIGHVMNRHSLHMYAKAKATSCNIAVTGYELVEAGASNIPGGEEFVKNAKFGKTMKAFAKPEGVDMDKDKDVDVEFMTWFTNRIIDFQKLTGNPDEYEYEADRSANDLMAGAGYDVKELDKIIGKLPTAWSFTSHHPGNDKRIEALGKYRTENPFGTEGGKAPAIPASANWPKPQS